MAFSKEKKKTNRNCPRKHLMANLPKTLKKFPKHAKITKGKVDKIKKMMYEQNGNISNEIETLKKAKELPWWCSC